MRGIQDQLSHFSSMLAGLLERRPLFVLAGFSLFYFPLTCAIAAQKPLWYDELVTVRIAQLPKLPADWRWILSETDPQPPLSYVLTRLCSQLIGLGPVSVRLPAILGFWVMSCCIFLIARRWCSGPYAVLAMFIPMASSAYRIYAIEARPYGLVLGFAGLALLFWQLLGDGRRSWWPALGLGLSLAGALFSHYYAILLFIPIGLGELVSSLKQRRIDACVWLAFAVGLAPLVFLYPTMAHSRQIFAPDYWARPSWGESLGGFFKNLLEAELLPLIAGLALCAFFPRPSARAETTPVKRSPPPLPISIALLGYLGLPIIGTAFAMLVTKAFTDRYVIATVIGLALVFALAAYRFGDGSPGLGALLLFGAIAWICAESAIMYGFRKESFAKMLREQDQLVQALKDHELVVMAEPQIYLQQCSYMPPQLATRLVYLQNADLAKRFGGSNTDEIALRGVRRFGLDVNVQEYNTFLAGHRHFLVYGSQGWVLAALTDAGADVRRRPRGFTQVDLPPGLLDKSSLK